MIRIILLLAIAAALFSCNQTNQLYDKPYFDFDSLVNKQITSLVSAKASLTKSVLLNGKQDQSTVTADSSVVAHELDVFSQLDFINKPLYRDGYEIQDGEKDTQSNLIIRKYVAKSPSPVPFVTFYYQDEFRHLKKIESVYQENNTLYSTQRQLRLEFDDLTGTVLISRYSLFGNQKMILNDSVKFSIEGTFLPGTH